MAHIQLLEFKNVKTRKAHKCWGCTKEFPAGTNMEVTTCIDSDFPISHAYWCELCQVLMKKLSPEDKASGFAFGEFADYCRDMGITN